MASLSDLIREKILWVVVSLSLGAGLMAAYGRERHDGRRPDKAWWITRFYIIPFLGIVTSWAVVRFALSNADAAMLSAVLALLGYEALRIITSKSKRALEAIGGDKVPPDDVPPFHSLVDTDDAGRAAAHVELSDPQKPRRSAIGSGLRDAFSEPAVTPPPEDMQYILRMLDPGEDGEL